MYISNGNKKMTVSTWNIPSKLTCPNSTELCRRNCYAVKAEIQYPNVKPCRMDNWQSTKAQTFAEDMIAALRRKRRVHRQGCFRIHESGDFYNQAYLDAWIKIARAYPRIKFLAFTKSWGLDYTDKPDNLIIYWSVWPDSEDIPVEGLKAYAGNCEDMDKPIHCLGRCDNCLVCFNGDINGCNVHFDIH